ncbi:MAG: hypothetical protein IIB66_12730 [Proteobacteria bacterium]|nr:hypothetical protein [Pseudomonadota bacterium]
MLARTRKKKMEAGQENAEAREGLPKEEPADVGATARACLGAIRLATGAARKGVPGARYNLGFLLGNSDDREDVIEAYKWFALLALDQYPGAAANRDRVARRLRPEDISEGERRAEAMIR